ncbi:uncharacterized protein LOC144248667 [Lonchura striata]
MIRRSRQVAAVKAKCARESTRSVHTSVTNWLMDQVSCTLDLAGSITGPCDGAFQSCISRSHPGSPEEWPRCCSVPCDDGVRIQARPKREGQEPGHSEEDDQEVTAGTYQTGRWRSSAPNRDLHPQICAR